MPKLADFEALVNATLPEFALWGVIPASSDPQARARYETWLAEGLHAGMPCLTDYAAVKFDPGLVLPRARSLLLVALPYPERDAPATGFVGRVAGFARGRDYHRVLNTLLKALATQLASHYPAAVWRPICDSVPLHEKFYAARAGLGTRLRNTLLGNSVFGTRFVLGALVTTHELPSRSVARGLSQDPCESCQRCLKACPTGALLPEGGLDLRRCLAWLTIEQRGPIPRELWPGVGDRVFGCDHCQTVCPLNAHLGEGLGWAGPDNVKNQVLAEESRLLNQATCPKNPEFPGRAEPETGFSDRVFRPGLVESETGSSDRVRPNPRPGFQTGSPDRDSRPGLQTGTPDRDSRPGQAESETGFSDRDSRPGLDTRMYPSHAGMDGQKRGTRDLFFHENAPGSWLDLEEVLALERDEDLVRRFGGTGLVRAKRRGLVRNALIVATNLLLKAANPNARQGLAGVNGQTESELRPSRLVWSGADGRLEAGPQSTQTGLDEVGQRILARIKALVADPDPVVSQTAQTAREILGGLVSGTK